jgi:hypothetical protein
VVAVCCAWLLLDAGTAGAADLSEWTLTWEYQLEGLTGGAKVTFAANIDGGPVHGSAPLLIQGESGGRPEMITGTFVLDGTVRDGMLVFRPQGSAMASVGDFWVPLDLFQAAEKVTVPLERGGATTVTGQATNTFRVEGYESYRLRVDVWQPVPARPAGRALPRGHRAGGIAHWRLSGSFNVVGTPDNLSLLGDHMGFSLLAWTPYSRPARRYGERLLPVGPFGAKRFLRPVFTATGVLQGRTMALTLGNNAMGLRFWTTRRGRVIGQTVARIPMPPVVATRRVLRYRKTCWQASPLPASGSLEPAACGASLGNRWARDPLARRIVIDQRRYR